MRAVKITLAALLFAVAPLALTSANGAPAAVSTAATRMIGREGHKIAFYVIPGSRGTIVFDAGSGQDASHWKTLAPELAKRTGFTVITYDRAGLGASDEVPGPWDVHAAVADLAYGLKALGATKNVILVSHSLAGEIATYLTGEHPSWFAGVVLVDANIPDFFSDETMVKVKKLYDPIVAANKAGPSTRNSRNFLALVASWDETNRAFHQAIWPAAVPVTVIVSEKTPLPEPDAARRWRDAEAQFAKRASNRTLVTATGSSHDVARDRPDVVIAAIEGIAERIR